MSDETADMHSYYSDGTLSCSLTEHLTIVLIFFLILIFFLKTSEILTLTSVKGRIF